MRHDTLEGQLAAFDEHAPMARIFAQQMLEGYWDTICEGARLRLIEGFPEYGHKTWERGEDELFGEALEEVEDEINYIVMQLERRYQEGASWARSVDGTPT